MSGPTSNTANEIDEVISVAQRHGLYLDRREVVTDKLREGWAIIPRHWGFAFYDYTIISPCCTGWSGGEMQRKRRAIKAARKDIAQHLARCKRGAS